ncbi:MAG: hypothetical protein V4555_06715 [Acidobacteriota bacterium]
MRKGWWIAGIVVLCLPLVLATWLMLAARWPKMDAMTMQMPMGVRSLVAEVALPKAGWGKQARSALERVTRLDPQNRSAWSRECTFYLGSANGQTDVSVCKTAISLENSAENWDGLGRAQERVGDECDAADSFTKASGMESNGSYGYVEQMGRAALRCGKLYDARAGLEAAIDVEAKAIQVPDQDSDDVDSTKEDQTTDRDYLIVTFDRMHLGELAAQTCSASHPEWKGCSCNLDAKKEVSCTEAKH